MLESRVQKDQKVVQSRPSDVYEFFRNPFSCVCEVMWNNVYLWHQSMKKKTDHSVLHPTSSLSSFSPPITSSHPFPRTFTFPSSHYPTYVLDVSRWVCKKNKWMKSSYSQSEVFTAKDIKSIGSGCWGNKTREGVRKGIAWRELKKWRSQ